MADTDKSDEADLNLKAATPLLRSVKKYECPKVGELDEQRLIGRDRLLHDPTNADLTIKCGSQEWKVHKAIVCPQSEFLQKACSGEFKVCRLFPLRAWVYPI